MSGFLMLEAGDYFEPPSNKHCNRVNLAPYKEQNQVLERFKLTLRWLFRCQ